MYVCVHIYDINHMYALTVDKEYMYVYLHILLLALLLLLLCFFLVTLLVFLLKLGCLQLLLLNKNISELSINVVILKALKEWSNWSLTQEQNDTNINFISDLHVHL